MRPSQKVPPEGARTIGLHALILEVMKPVQQKGEAGRALRRQPVVLEPHVFAEGLVRVPAVAGTADWRLPRRTSDSSPGFAHGACPTRWSANRRGKSQTCLLYTSPSPRD